MVPLYPEISFATGAITSHEVEAEPSPTNLASGEMSGVTCAFRFLVLGGALKLKEYKRSRQGLC